MRRVRPGVKGFHLRGRRDTVMRRRVGRGAVAIVVDVRGRDWCDGVYSYAVSNFSAIEDEEYRISNVDWVRRGEDVAVIWAQTGSARPQPGR